MTRPTTAVSAGHVQGLDLLRAAAILSVVIHHGNYLLPEAAAAMTENLLVNGVTAFFVLSGFLIGGMLIRSLERQLPSLRGLFDFWVRRWMRTLPAYLVVLTVLAALALIAGSHDLRTILPYYFFSQNLWWGHPAFFPEAWSLSIQQWFYIVFPAVLFLLVGAFRVKPRSAVLGTALVLMAACIAVRYLQFAHWEGPITSHDLSQMFRKPVVMRWDSMMIGVLGAYLVHYRKELWYMAPRTGLIIGLVSLMALDQIGHYDERNGIGFFACVPSFDLTSLAILLLIPFLERFHFNSTRFQGAIVTVANASYSIYLVHLSLVQFKLVNHLVPRLVSITGLQPSEGAITAINYVGYWVFTMIAALLLHRLVELPFMRLRDTSAKRA